MTTKTGSQAMIEINEAGEIKVILPESMITEIRVAAEKLGNDPDTAVELYREQVRGVELTNQLFSQMLDQLEAQAAIIEEQAATIEEYKKEAAGVVS